MLKFKRDKLLTTFLIAVIMVATFLLSGCQPAVTETEQQAVFEAEGILIGQIDNNSVKIEVAGTPRAYALDEGVSVQDIADGSLVAFSYVEGEGQPVVLTITARESVPELISASGIYNGQIDSHSVEIEVDGQIMAFALGEEIDLDLLESGSHIEFTYHRAEDRPVLVSIDAVEQPAGGAEQIMVGEGQYIGQIDGQSVEIKLKRAFVLAEDLNLDGIEDGALVAFTFIEEGPGAVLESIEAVDQPREGNYLHGILVGRIDNRSVEIEYYQAFAIGAADLEGLSDGVEVLFTYEPGEHRPILVTIESL